MCGINGIYAYGASAPPISRKELLATRDHMRRRGPDGEGEWWSADRAIAFGHRRLSIVDLSERANQPMQTADGALVITYNGEIYNAPELRRRLEADGARFRTTSDTEVLLHLYERRGPAMASELRGMFAFAIWDDRRKGLLLARDPYGIKPLYISDDGKTWRFASQVKALLTGAQIDSKLDPAGVVGFYIWGSVPEPFTMYRGIRAFPAGHTQWVDARGAAPPQAFASIPEVLSNSQRSNSRGIRAAMRSAFLDSVRAHLVSDVEVGLFLSSGIDSSALLGLMRDAGQNRVRAITLAFQQFAGTHDNEAPLAAKVAAHYDADHVTHWITEREFEDSLPQILGAMDQPSIDGINTWFVAKAAREAGLKVAISGLGGDELLAGYATFREVPAMVRAIRAASLAPPIRDAVNALIRRLLTDRYPKASGVFAYGGSLEGAYLLRRGLFLPSELHGELDPELVVDGLARLEPLARAHDAALSPVQNTLARMISMESVFYLRNQLLRDADWAGMHHSLEIRTPLVDFSLLRDVCPYLRSFSGGKGKRMLARAPQNPLPRAVLTRPKTGFSVPMGAWLHNSGKGGSWRRGLASRAWARRVLTSPLVSFQEDASQSERAPT
jgi:asparagine synthase (glutamine-hydrolysing)